MEVEISFTICFQYEINKFGIDAKHNVVFLGNLEISQNLIKVFSLSL